MSSLTEALQGLTPEQRKLVELRLKKKGIAVNKLPISRRGEERKSYPLSFAQQRLWFLNRLEPDNSSYTVSSPMRIEGTLSLVALHRALQGVVDRHEALRTRFDLVDSAPVQIPMEGFRQPMPVIELAGLEARRREEVAVVVTSIELQRSFDLAAGSLLRTAVLRLSAEEHSLLLNMHHIVSDGWSLTVFFGELMALYEAESKGEPVALPPLPIQYIDFALWQREVLEGEVLDRQLAYWEEQLRGAPALLELPIDRPRAALQDNRGHFVGQYLPPDLTERIRQFSKERGVTPFVTLISTFAALLARSTRDEDIPVGIPVAGRNRQEIESLIGFFVGTLVLRADVTGQPTFAELVGRVGKVNGELNSNQDVPFEQLVDRLAPERSLDHTPLFQVSFSHQPKPGADVATGEGSDSGTSSDSNEGSIQIRPQEGSNPVSMFDLSLALEESPNFITGNFVANAALFDHTTLARFSRRYDVLLRAALGAPERSLGALPILSPAESQQLLREWAVPMPEAGFSPVHRAVAAVAADRPERIALLAEGPGRVAVAVSYGELLRRAEGLARHLRQLGVGPEVAVALAVERSPSMIETMLGILLAGGCYLPLDPAYPDDRLRFMLGDAKPRVLLTQTSLLPRFAGVAEGIERVMVDDPALSTSFAEEPGRRLPEVDPGSAAYLIYTSGSTGKPKGVVVTHRGLANYAAAGARAYRLSAEDRLLQFSSISFDASAEEIFTTLHAGATLFLRPEAMAGGPSVFFATVERWRLTVLGLPTAYWHELAASGVAPPGSIRLTILGGEAALPERVEGWCERSPARSRLVNTYGPTETTICATHWQVDCEAVAAGATPLQELGDVPIGHQVDGAWLRVLDGSLRPVPIGVAGELAIGGAGVARGYLGQPALTAERFVPDGYSSHPGERLYRSGDLVRTLQDGTLQFLGRVDLQVKVRGFRIEPGEVEAALTRHPAVVEAVVGVDPTSQGEKRLVAWLVATQEGDAEGDEAASPSAAELRAFLAERLPAHLIPTLFVPLESMPKNAAGKLDRRSLPAPEGGRLAAGEEFVPPSSAIESTIATIWCAALKVEKVGVNDNFFDLGGHSLLLIRVQEGLQEALEREIPILDLFRFPTVAALAERFQPGDEEESGAFTRRAEERFAAVESTSSARIAIVGMSARFPMARTPEEFWTNLRDGVECLTFFEREELIEAGVHPEVVDNPDFVGCRGWYEGVGQFDARLFNIPPREAEILDPQQRIFLECSWEALEHAGYAPESFAGRIGLFAGTGLNAYIHHFMSNPWAIQGVTPLQLALANDKDFLTTRVSYKLDLRGPSVNVQSACSTSLVAAHLACRALALGECEMALAGGVGIDTFRKGGHLFAEGGIASSDGHNRSFDAKADGSAGGDGAGIVVLKRLDDALRDGDTIYAVIRGSALNNDGSNKVGFTAPSIEGQAEVIAAAQVAGEVSPDEVSYVETHGTATPLGDPIEIAALREIFGMDGSRKSCALGAVKSNIGHTDTAAGAAGLIKTALALHHKQIPPSLHYEQPNPKIDFDNSPLYVNTELVDWPVAKGKRRIAGVSSFGLGGTNAHLVVEEGPERAPSGPSRPWQLLPLSGLSSNALEAVNQRLANHLTATPDVDLADVAFTLQQGRTRLPSRQVLVAKDKKDAAKALASRDPRRILVSTEERRQRPVVWLLPGLGDHYPGMGRELYETESAFRGAVDECCDLLTEHLGEDLRLRLFPPVEAIPVAKEAGGGGELDLRALLGRGGGESQRPPGPLDRTRWAQPALFVIEYALAQVWLEWGVVPEAMIGYSLGEYTAACLAGVFSLPDALRLVAERARLIESLPAGGMVAVPLAEEEVLALLARGYAETLSLAAVSGPELCVVAGEEEALGRFEEQLADRDLVSRRLRTTHAFHSHMMRPLAERFTQVVASVEARAPRIPYLSNVTGGWVRASEVQDPSYWVRHLCQPVRFHQGLCELLGQSERVLLEVGPGQALSTTAMQHPERGEGQLSVTSIRDERQTGSDVAYLLQAAGRLWLSGVTLDWRGMARHEERRRLPLPTYPFEHQRYWIERLSPQAMATRRPQGMKTARVGDWFHLPTWRPTQPLASKIAWPSEGASSRWLVLTDAGGWGEALAGLLESNGQSVERIASSEAEGDMATLFDGILERLRKVDQLPGHIVAGWQLDAAVDGGADAGAEIEPFDSLRFERAQRLGLYAVSALVASLARLGIAEEIALTVLTSGHRAVDRADRVRPELATLPAALTVMAQEYRNLHCRTIDLDPAQEVASGEASGQLAKLLAEVAPRTSAPSPSELTVAYRGRMRYALGYEPLRLQGDAPSAEQPDPDRPGLRQDGVYLLTGGFGYVAGIVANKLARRFGARLALLGRTEIPPREEWEGWLETHDESDPVSLRLLRIRQLEEAGAEVLPLVADVADVEAMRAALATTRQRFGALNGVFHLAGVMSDEEMMMSIDQLKPARCAPLFKTKVEALHTLSTVLAEVEAAGELEFCLLFSSMASVLGGLGFTAYTAANAFVDAFAARRQQLGRYSWLAANWDGWDPAEPETEVEGAVEASRARYTMSPSESTEAIHRLVALEGVGQVVVSTGNLAERIGRWVEFTADPPAEKAGGEAAPSGHARPDLQTPFVAPCNEIESEIAGLWSELLGIEEIGIHDNFFQLGGDSLLATQVAARIRGVLKVDIPLRAFFTASTVAELAELASEDERGEELSAIELALAEIEGLSDDDLDSALDEDAGEAGG